MIVLASTSPYRRALLERLRLPFTVISPHVDETVAADELPRDTALRLALAKARAVYAQAAGAAIIGSDQVASLGGEPLGKPGSRAAAILQLRRMQGQRVLFHTGLALVGPEPQSVQIECVDTLVQFRELSDDEIESYVDQDQPFDVAGAAKIESLGIALVTSVQSTDPTALIGLPLIACVSMLRAVGIRVPMPE